MTYADPLALRIHRTAFKTAYAEPDNLKAERSFNLQDLTEDDMRTFIKTMLENDRRFVHLTQIDAPANSLVEHILDRASGVFLWVYLVVQSLKRGLTESDDAQMLQKRLDELVSAHLHAT